MQSIVSNGPGGRMTYVPAVALLAVALSLLIWAFFQRSLTPDQRTISNLFYAMVLSGEGFLVGGLLITVSGSLKSHVKVTVRAIGGAAGLVIALWYPLFAASDPLVKRPAFGVTEPSDGELVEPTIEITGFTPHTEMRHYVVVTAPMGGDTVQNEPVKVSESGQFRAKATVGSAGAGTAQRFVIRVVATNSILEPGPYIAPPDVLVSDAVTVTRVERIATQ